MPDEKDEKGNADERSNGGDQEGQQGDADKQTKKGADELQAELDSIRAALKKANAEAANRRKKLTEFETAEQKRKDAELTEIEKLQKASEAAEKRAATAEAGLRESLLRAAVHLEAVKLGFHNPEDAALADLSGVTVEDGGGVTGADVALKALVKSRPYLIAKNTDNPDIDAMKRGKEKKGAVSDEKKESVNRRFGL